MQTIRYFIEKQKMDIKDRIEKIGKYFQDMNVASGNNIIYVHVMFPKGWGFSELTEYDYNVKVVPDEIPGYFYFFTDLSNGFERVFDAIDYNINFNEEAQIKVALLREKIEELKDIFENEDIDTIKTLEFKYKKKKTKQVKAKNNEPSETSESLENNETSDTNNESENYVAHEETTGEITNYENSDNNGD
jgi:hypothetical protein